MNAVAQYRTLFRPLSGAALLVCLMMVSGCATPEGEYPSLAIRDIERAQGTMDVPALAPLPLPETTPQNAGAIANMEAAARSANQAFLAAAPAVRRMVQAANGAPIGSDRWAEGQVALANLQSIRSRTMIALANLDRVYVDSATQGESLDRISAAHRSVTAMAEQQDTLITALLRNLR